MEKAIQFTVPRVPETFSFVIAGFCQGETGRPSARTEDSHRTGLGPGSALAEKRKKLACENSRFFSLLAAGDVSRGGTSATQRQKFHTDVVKSFRNPVISADWTM